MEEASATSPQDKAEDIPMTGPHTKSSGAKPAEATPAKGAAKKK